MVGTAIGIVVTFDPGECEHRIGGGGFDAIVGAATAGEEVVARPRYVVPGDDAEQHAVRANHGQEAGVGGRSRNPVDGEIIPQMGNGVNPVARSQTL